MVLMAGLGSPTAGFGQGRSFLLNYKQVPIRKLIERVAKETGRSILFDEQVRGNVSVVTKRPVTEDEAWSILGSTLSMLGFSILPSTVDNWRIAKQAQAVGEAPFVSEVGTESASFVTALIPIENADLQAVLDVLAPLSGARVTLVAFESTHSLIASGPEQEIARLTTIADELDRVDEFRLRVRVLRYRSVDEIEPLVEARLESDGISGRRLQVWSDRRTNSVIFRGIAAEVSRLARFIDRLDQPPEDSGRVRVLRVLNRDPEEIGELIRALGQPTASAIAAVTGGVGASELSGRDFVIVVDKASRSLVVSADAATQIAIRDVLEMLDELPQQIAVDITISELRTPRNFALGFGFTLPFSTGSGGSDLQGVIVVSPTPGGIPDRPSNQSALFGRLARDTGVPFTIDGADGVQIPILQSAVITAGKFTAVTEVLIQPSLIITVGDRHEIFVGTNVPIPVSDGSGIGSAEGLTGVPTLTQTTRFERTDIGIRLEIEAKAGREGTIQLDLDIDISSVGPSLAGDISRVGPTYFQRNVSATVMLGDGETAIIASHHQLAEGRARSEVPWLSQIPFLGWLFTSKAEEDQDVRLVIAVRARRVSTPADLVADSIRRRLAFQRRNARDATLPSHDGLPFGVRVTTRTREDDADAIAEGLSLRGYQTVIHGWSLNDTDYFDVYVVSLASMAEAAEVAGILSKDGWTADLIILPTRS